VKPIWAARVRVAKRALRSWTAPWTPSRRSHDGESRVLVTASPRFRDAEVGGHPATAEEVRGPSRRAGRGGVAAAVAIQRAGSARPR